MQITLLQGVRRSRILLHGPLHMLRSPVFLRPGLCPGTSSIYFCSFLDSNFNLWSCKAHRSLPGHHIERSSDLLLPFLVFRRPGAWRATLQIPIRSVKGPFVRPIFFPNWEGIRKGQGYTALPACDGSCAEAYEIMMPTTKPGYLSLLKKRKKKERKKAHQVQLRAFRERSPFSEQARASLQSADWENDKTGCHTQQDLHCMATGYAAIVLLW
eukprot:1136307-Pelagomonas_calceolata.AAC.1